MASKHSRARQVLSRGLVNDGLLLTSNLGHMTWEILAERDMRQGLSTAMLYRAPCHDGRSGWLSVCVGKG
jgi:hypothetical protein